MLVVFQGVKTAKNNEKLSKNCFFGIINSKLAKTNLLNCLVFQILLSIQLCFSIMFDKNKQAERIQNKCN